MRHNPVIQHGMKLLEYIPRLKTTNTEWNWESVMQTNATELMSLVIPTSEISSIGWTNVTVLLDTNSTFLTTDGEDVAQLELDMAKDAVVMVTEPTGVVVAAAEPYRTNYHSLAHLTQVHSTSNRYWNIYNRKLLENT